MGGRLSAFSLLLFLSSFPRFPFFLSCFLFFSFIFVSHLSAHFPSPLPCQATRSLTIRHRRWLTHSISDYYGLDSKSVMVGNPARRVVYVGIKQNKKQPGPRHKPPSRPVLPPPLWEMF